MTGRFPTWNLHHFCKSGVWPDNDCDLLEPSFWGQSYSVGIFFGSEPFWSIPKIAMPFLYHVSAPCEISKKIAGCVLLLADTLNSSEPLPPKQSIDTLHIIGLCVWKLTIPLFIRFIHWFLIIPFEIAENGMVNPRFSDTPICTLWIYPVGL